jgi:hypothetical protein
MTFKNPDYQDHTAGLFEGGCRPGAAGRDARGTAFRLRNTDGCR